MQLCSQHLLGRRFLQGKTMLSTCRPPIASDEAGQATYQLIDWWLAEFGCLAAVLVALSTLALALACWLGASKAQPRPTRLLVLLALLFLGRPSQHQQGQTARGT